MDRNGSHPADPNPLVDAENPEGRRHHLILLRGISSMKWLDHLFGGPKDMAAFPAGTKAPHFSLPAVSSGKDGGEFSLQAALKKGPVLAAFFKVSCPTCQYTFPSLESIHKAHGGKQTNNVGILHN